MGLYSEEPICSLALVFSSITCSLQCFLSDSLADAEEGSRQGRKVGLTKLLEASLIYTETFLGGDLKALHIGTHRTRTDSIQGAEPVIVVDVEWERGRRLGKFSRRQSLVWPS